MLSTVSSAPGARGLPDQLVVITLIGPYLSTPAGELVYSGTGAGGKSLEVTA